MKFQVLRSSCEGKEAGVLLKELQVADAIAWAFFQKYERGDSRFYNAIAPQVILEEVVIE
jgi:hypothetical protein